MKDECSHGNSPATTLWHLQIWFLMNRHLWTAHRRTLDGRSHDFMSIPVSNEHLKKCIAITSSRWKDNEGSWEKMKGILQENLSRNPSQAVAKWRPDGRIVTMDWWSDLETAMSRHGGAFRIVSRRPTEENGLKMNTRERLKKDQFWDRHAIPEWHFIFKQFSCDGPKAVNRGSSRKMSLWNCKSLGGRSISCESQSETAWTWSGSHKKTIEKTLSRR